MADTGRDEKLAAARRKLKKFQQKRTPTSSPAVKNDSTSPSTSYTSSADSSSCAQRLEVEADDVVTDNRTISPERNSVPESDFSSTEKIRQICKDLNGLMNEDLLINGDPVINEIELLERKNQELEDNVRSHKRSNQQLNNQVNEQRKQIIQLQEQIKRERNELANRQLLEQRSLKEQLEVHIQTIGILVSEKQDLQSTVSQLQRKYQIKENENTEVNGRLQAVRQRVAELERNTANLSAMCEKQQEDLKQLRQDKNKSESKNIASSFEKEELSNENAELKVKLGAKIDEVESLCKKSEEVSFKLKKAELIVQQLSTEPNATATQSLVQQLQEEKASLDGQVNELNSALHKLGTEKGELLQRHSEEVEQYCNKMATITKQLEACQKEKEDWDQKEQEFQKTAQKLEHTIAELKDSQAAQQSEFTQAAASEIERLTNEKEKLAFHLRDQNSVVARFERSELEYQHEIHELQVTIGRLEENCHDKATLLESIQSDKETISRALKQNKDLKTQLEELEERFVKMSNENMELATELETEKHVSKEVKMRLETYEKENSAWDRKEVEYQENILNLQKTLAEFKDNEATKQLASEEADKLLREKDELSQSLQDQIGKLVRQKDELSQSLQDQADKLLKEKDELSQSLQDQVILLQKEEDEWTRKEEELHRNLLNLQKTIADLKDNEALQQSQLTRVAASEIEKLTLEKDQLSQSLREQDDKLKSLVIENSKLNNLLTPKDSDSDLENNTETEFPSWDDFDDSNEIRKARPRATIDSQGVEEVPHVARPYMNGYNESPEETDSSEEMNIVPTQLKFSSPPPSSKYTKQEDMIDALSASVRQLEMEREQLTHMLQTHQEQHTAEVAKLNEHMDLQLRQQLQQQQRNVQEHFQEQIHELQQKIHMQQAVIEKQKEQIERQSENRVSNMTLEEEEHLSHEALKTAFSKLQARFVEQMEEKASLTERIAEVEHKNVQLAEETETIGEYISLYQTQRNALKLFYRDRERLITQISNEKADMQSCKTTTNKKDRQTKIAEFQDLVKQLLEERKFLQAQTQNLQNIVNSRLSAHEHETEIPGLQATDQIIVAQGSEDLPSNDTYENSELEISAAQSHVQSEQPPQDATAQQILHLLKQLGPGERDSKTGWETLALRRTHGGLHEDRVGSHEFLPCRYCSPRLIRL